MKLIIAILIFIIAGSFVRAQSKMKFTKQDSVKLNFCNCDSLTKEWKLKSNAKNDGPEYDGNGWVKLYNFRNDIGECGFFQKYNFMYGLHYMYDDDGKLIKIKKYLNGKLVGVCEIKKK